MEFHSTLGPLLFLIYINHVNDLLNCSDKLSFKIFADDANGFASESNLKILEALMNSELERGKEWCDVNKLSINMSKTNFMIIKSTRKKDMPVNIQIRNSDRMSHPLVRKNHIKYLGVMIDDCVSWKYHISYICSQISRNISIMSKLRHYLSIKQLKQINYNLIYPYVAYASLAWGSTYISSLQKVQVKQNHVDRLLFFANIRKYTW